MLFVMKKDKIEIFTEIFTTHFWYIQSIPKIKNNEVLA